MFGETNDCVLRQNGHAGGTASKAHLFLDCCMQFPDQMEPIGNLLGPRCAFTDGWRIWAAAVPADHLHGWMVTQPLVRTLDAPGCQ